MDERVTYGRLRKLLVELGFKENRVPGGVSFKHDTSDTVFLFRPYRVADRVQPAEVFLVRKMLDEKGLLEPDSFEMLLTKTPA
jgi:hypothetical protein